MALLLSGLCVGINRTVFTGVTGREILSWQYLLRVLVSELLLGELKGFLIFTTDIIKYRALQ